MVATFDQLIGESELDREKINRFLEGRELPIVEGRRVTFVFHGRADEVRLRHFIFGLPSSQELHRVEDTDLWYLRMDVPANSRIEYKFERVVGDQHEWLMDPLNPKTARDPYGANSVCYGVGYVEPEWVGTDPEARRGSLEQIEVPSRALRRKCPVTIYLPARFRRRRSYPLLVVHDGEDFMRYASLRTVLDNLIHRVEVAPMIVALTQSRRRLREYAADSRHARFVTDELVPALETQFPLIQSPASRCLMGASFGAVASLYTAWRNPGLYGKLLLLSGSFAFSEIGDHERGPAFDPVVKFVNRFRENPGRPADKVFLSCGVYESLIYENRSMYPLLDSTEMELRYVEARDGHNWENWRDRLREGLSWLFPGPLWMIYE